MLMYRGRVDQRIASVFVKFSLEYTLALAHRMYKKCYKLLPFLCVELT